MSWTLLAAGLSALPAALSPAAGLSALPAALSPAAGLSALPAALFPNGVLHYAVGGLLVGLGVVVVYLGTAIAPGASTFLETTLSYVSDLPRFNRGTYLRSRGWRVVFTAGMVVGAAAYAFLLGDGVWVTAVPAWRLFAGGVLVGVGTRIGKGCTSGHGVCGVGSRSRTSLVNVATFLAVAVLTAHLLSAAGVAP